MEENKTSADSKAEPAGKLKRSTRVFVKKTTEPTTQKPQIVQPQSQLQTQTQPQTQPLSMSMSLPQSQTQSQPLLDHQMAHQNYYPLQNEAYYQNKDYQNFPQPVPQYSNPSQYSQVWSQPQPSQSYMHSYSQPNPTSVNPYIQHPSINPSPMGPRPAMGTNSRIPKTFKPAISVEEEENKIKESICNRLKSTTLVIHSSKFDPLHHITRSYAYSLETKLSSLITEDPSESEGKPAISKGKVDIFELYSTVPIKEEEERKKKEEEERIRREEEERIKREEEERRKKEEEERKKKEEEERKRREEIEREMRIRRNKSSGPMERYFMQQEVLDELMGSVGREDREVLMRCVRNIKEKGAISMFMMMELGGCGICKEPVNMNLVNASLIKREFEKREQGGFGKGRRPNYKNKDYNRYEKRNSTYVDKKGNDKEKSGFVRKELTEDEKKMKDEASLLQDKLKERNKLSSQTELDIKMITNKITPTNYKLQKDKILKMIVDSNFDKDTIKVIGKTIFSKACIEKYYQYMYTDLCTDLVKKEATRIVDLDEAKSGKKGQFDKKIRIKNIKEAKKRSVLRGCILENVKDHVEKLREPYEVDKSDPDWEDKLSRHRDKVVGNVRFIGSLFNKEFIPMNLLFAILHDYLMKEPLDASNQNQQITRTHLELIEACCILIEITGKEVESKLQVSEGKKELTNTKKEQSNRWTSLFDILEMFRKDEVNIDSRIRILIKNLFEVKDSDWEKNKEEGPLKLNELHKKFQKEQEGIDYNEEYEEYKKKKRTEKKRKTSDGYFPGMEFTEVGGADDEEDEDKYEQEDKIPQKNKTTEENRFDNITKEAFTDICIGNYKEYLETEVFDFDVFKNVLKYGKTKSDIVFGVLEKLFDLENEKILRFDQYINSLIDELKISKTEVNEGVNKFNTELVLLECDYVYVDQQYSKIIYKLMINDLFEFDKLLWYNDEEKISDIFIKVIIRVVEYKFTLSEHDSDETADFIKQFKIKETLSRIKEFLLDENLFEEYSKSIVSHDTLYSLLDISNDEEN